MTPYAVTPADLFQLVSLARGTTPPTDPYGAALLCWIESAGFDPSNAGPPGADPKVGGLNQMSVPNLTQFGLTREEWLRMGARDQLPWIFRFWSGLARRFNGGRFPGDGPRLLALNFLPASYAASGADTDPDAAICGKGGPYAQFYPGNSFYDPHRTGAITVRTIADRFAIEDARGGPRWEAIKAGIRNAGGGSPLSPPPTPSGAPGSGSPPPVLAAGVTGGGGGALLLLALVGGIVAKRRRSRAAPPRVLAWR